MYERYIENVRDWCRYWIPNYFQYREAIKQIALQNWKKNEVGIVRGGQWEDDWVIFPMDDDDWYKPELIARATDMFEKDPDLDLLVWDYWCYSVRSCEKMMFRLAKWRNMICGNAYAIRGRVANNRYLQIHTSVNRLLSRVKWKELEPSSVWVRHSAGHSINKQLLVHDDKDVCDIGPLRPIPKQLSWATEEIQQVYELTKQVQPNLWLA